MARALDPGGQLSTSNMDLMATVERHLHVPGYRAAADSKLREIDY